MKEVEDEINSLMIVQNITMKSYNYWKLLKKRLNFSFVRPAETSIDLYLLREFISENSKRTNL